MESRIDELEVRLAFQDELLDALNQTVARQQQELSLLQDQMRILYRMLQNQSPDAAGNAPQHEIPPHY
ncbi:SlyX protein [Crenobacter luteus]|uniref:Protein SlyX homolog n=1 Tax=Crenobacter luteus TaxID=1452487 RepID=A0A163CW91_9NEIS|nr:SlyX family protein [Crenobacter luteus]KZE33326.1 SlyX protein [Crenobacter luteus]TCP13581.1 SlyX protein [Crenobacter luteus]